MLWLPVFSSISHGAMDWSAVCDCVISWSYSRFIVIISYNVLPVWLPDDWRMVEIFGCSLNLQGDGASELLQGSGFDSKVQLTTC